MRTFVVAFLLSLSLVSMGADNTLAEPEEGYYLDVPEGCEGCYDAFMEEMDPFFREAIWYRENYFIQKKRADTLEDLVGDYKTALDDSIKVSQEILVDSKKIIQKVSSTNTFLGLAIAGSTVVFIIDGILDLVRERR